MLRCDARHYSIGNDDTSYWRSRYLSVCAQSQHRDLSPTFCFKAWGELKDARCPGISG
jgi:hypothetical protein